jgi:drug/metabolite transporter (DMT)-like permease
VKDSGSTIDPTRALSRSYGLVLLAGTLWSAGGLIVREIETASEWQLIFYRSLALAVTLWVVLTVRNRMTVMVAFRDAGTTGILAGLCLAVASISFIFSLTHTTVANCLFLVSTSPFMAAVLGRVILGEGVRRFTWVAMGGALFGIGVMVAEGFAGGDLFGHLTALLAALGFACFIVTLRRGSRVEMLPAVCLAGLFGAIVAGALVVSDGPGLVIPVHDLALSAFYGGLLGCGLTVFTIGSRHIPATELALLPLTEVVLGPIWVWLGVGEVPSPLTFLGGSIVLAAIVGQAVVGIRRRQPPIGAV